MKKIPDLFPATEDFPLVFITEEQYKANKGNLDALNTNPYARVYAFYNVAGENSTLYEVSGKFGGSNRLIINNLSSYTVELRRDGIYGEPLGFARTGGVNQVFHLETDDYQLFPVFKKYIPTRDIIQTIYPKYASGLPKSVSFGFGGDNGDNYTLDVSGYLGDQSVTISTGAAYLVINNQSDTGVKLFKGGSVQTNSAGIATINNGLTKTFQIGMPEVTVGDNVGYASQLTIGSYTVGESGNTVNIGSHILLVDHIYTVNVDRDTTSGLFECEFVESGTVNLEDFTHP
jgi:hypothetical protein